MLLLIIMSAENVNQVKCQGAAHREICRMFQPELVVRCRRTFPQLQIVGPIAYILENFINQINTIVKV
jgi:hypothetical protein